MDSWSKFLTRVESAIDTLEKSGCDVPYFRGHGDVSWPLIPSLGRKKYYPDLERLLYYDFLTHAGPLIPSYNTSWDVLFAMRHHALPTRLLDWTESFSVALYFAVKNFSKCAAIWILDPFELNGETYKATTIPHPENDFKHSYYEYFIVETAPFHGQVVAVRPTKTYLRVIAQKAGFTIHQNLDQSLESLFPKHLVKIELPQTALSGAVKFLKLAGITEYSLFPDLDGLSRWLHEMHGL